MPFFYFAPVRVRSFQPIFQPLHASTGNCRADTSPKSLFLFEGLFGQKDTGDDDLATFSLPADQSDALAEYIRQWAGTLPDSKLLTTPVEIVAMDDGAQILFRPKESTYKSKEEELATEEGMQEEDAMSDEKSIKQGGVEVLVDGEGEVVARRCEMEEGTMIREMSEEAIVESLKKAMDVWKSEH